MPAFHLYRTPKLSLALLANIIHLILLYTLQSLLDILFSSHLRITYSSPPFLLGPFEIPLLLPTSFVIGPIMEIYATISEWTITRIMPIFTKPEIVIKPACVPNSAVHSGWTLSLSKLFLRIDDLVLCECVIRIAIDSPVYFSINFSFLNVFGDGNILHILLFCQLLLQQQLLCSILFVVTIW